MPQKPYNNSAKPTALPLERVRRQSLSVNAVGKKAVVFIDGSNWYHKLKNLLAIKQLGDISPLRPPTDFDVRAFAISLVAPDTLLEIRYYIGKVRRIKGDAKSETLYANQQKLIRFLQKQKVSIGFGHLIN